MPDSRLGPARARSTAAAALFLLALGAGLVAPPAAAERRLDVHKLEADYVQALELLAKGEREQALEALVRLELEALGSHPSMSRIDRVWRYKLAVVRKALELTSPEVLVPVIVLHHDAYQRYREANEPILARHARDMAADLAAYRAQSTKSEADRRFAGWVLASFGASLLDLRTASTGASILRDAVDISPDNPAALLGLAWAHEIHGEYHRAIERLDQLVAVEPEHHHGRLRRAICHQRLGNLETAERSLRQLLKDATEPWIRSLAYQERARTLAMQDDLEGAAALLDRALAEFPSEQEIVILLASLHERLGRPAEALDVIEHVQPVAPEQVSARYVYDRRPDLGIDDARATLRAMMDDRLDILASGLRWWVGTTEAATAEVQQGGAR